MYAVTSLGDEVFVARLRSQKVEVYDAGTLSLQRCIKVPGLGRNVYGLTACTSNNCLYVSDWCNHSVHRAQLAGGHVVMKWFVASRPAGLSVNNARNLVVACLDGGENKLQEYTTHGSLVREICLQTGMTSPRHAVQLSSGDYVVSRNWSPGVVIVDVHGQVLHMYGQLETPVGGLMGRPRGLAVTKNDDILVADSGNHRILSINTSLCSVQELALPVGDGMHYPWSLCLDESRGRLYVGEYGGKCRVLVFGDVGCGSYTTLPNTMFV